MNHVFTFVLDWLQLNEQTAFGLTQGLIVAGIFTLALAFIYLFPKWKWYIAALIIAGITPLATLGFWYSTGELGISDWDYYFSLHHGHRLTLLEYHQLPHWNPYICGGTAGIADPEFRFFTPTFLIQLIAGIETGFPLAIWFSIAFGGIGILILSKRLGLSVYPSLLAATVHTFSSVTIIEIVEGHPNVFAAMFIPWIFWAWLGAYRARLTAQPAKWFTGKWNIITAAFLAVTFFQGGIYLLMYTALAFIILPFLTKHPKIAWGVNIASGIWAAGFAAIKIIPVFLWLSQFQDEMYASSASTLSSLHHIFFGRYLHGSEGVIPSQGSGWHEYSAYIGPFAAASALVGLVAFWRNRTVRALAVAALLATLLSSSGPALKPFFDQAPWFPRSNISRVVLFAVIPISLLAGFGLEWVKTRTSKRAFTAAAVLVLGMVAADLFGFSYLLSEQAFVLPRSLESLPPATEPLQHSPFNYETRHNGSDYARAYTDVLQGYGMMNYCSVLTPPRAARIITDELWNGTAQVENDQTRQKGSYEVVSWSPNKTVLRVEVPQGGAVVLNTNYAKGWIVNGQPAINIYNRVGTRFEEAGTYTVTFEYFTPGFAAGAVISFLTGLAGMLSLRRAVYPKTPHTQA